MVSFFWFSFIFKRLNLCKLFSQVCDLSNGVKITECAYLEQCVHTALKWYEAAWSGKLFSDTERGMFCGFMPFRKNAGSAADPGFHRGIHQGALRDTEAFKRAKLL